MTKLEIESIQIVDEADVARSAADLIASRLRQAVAARGKASIALSGGNTPRRIYAELATLPVEWERVDVFFGDERCVPADDASSNYRMAKEALFDRVRVPNVFRMEGERVDLGQAAEEYAQKLPAAVDLILLGMGEDGHTASLFPGNDWSRPTGRRVIVVKGAPKPPPVRMSVTPDVIWAARARLIVTTGEGKAQNVRRALEGDACPAVYPIHTARNATWLIDRAAAALLSH